MSGVTEGTTNESATGVVVPLPILLAAGAVVGTVTAAGYLYQGAVRVSKKAYGAVQKKAAEIAQEQIRQVQAEIEQMSRVSGQVKVEELVSPRKHILKHGVSLESRQEAALQDFLIQLERQRNFREQYEKKRNLREDVSREISREIKEYRQKLQELQEKKQYQKAEREARLRKLAQKRQKQYLLLLERVQPLLGQTMESLYPQELKNLRKALANQEQDLSTLDRFEENKWFKLLQQKASLFKDSQVQEQLLKLVEWQQEFLANPLLNGFLEKNEKKEVFKKFVAKRHKAEHGALTDQDIRELKDIQTSLVKICQQRDEVRRFSEALEKAKQALYNRGFNRISQANSPDERYRVLTGTDEEGHRVFIRIIRPGVNDENIPHIQVKADDFTYDSEEACVGVRKALMYELESFGLYLNFKEMLTHYRDRVREEALEEVRRQLKEKHPDIKVEMVNNSLIKINGKDFLWELGTSVEKFIGMVTSVFTEGDREGIPPETEPPEEEGIRETD